MPNEAAQYSIGDLAGLAGATPRTIRYYVAQGLLPAPAGAGPGAHYTDDHLARLRLIRRLQRQHQPLSEIRLRVGALGEQDVADLLADDEPAETQPSSALEYLRGLLSPQPASPAPVAAPAASALPSVAVPEARSAPARAAMGRPALFRRAAPPMPVHAAEAASEYDTLADAPATAPIAAAPVAAALDAPSGELRSQWDRIALTPNIEIHVRRPLGRLENRRVERLITIARQMLREEQP